MEYGRIVMIGENNLCRSFMAEVILRGLLQKRGVEIDSANANIIKDGKVQVSDLQSMYESLGTTCTNE